MFAPIKQTINIRDVISRYVTLTGQGNRYTGLCPFHDDHRPSLTVDTRKQNYVCYACGAKGDVITFVRQIEKCTFAAALEKLKVKSEELKVHRRVAPDKNEKRKGDQASQQTERISTHYLRPVTYYQPLLSTLMPYMSGDHDLSVACLDFEVGVAPHRLSIPGRVCRDV